MRLPDTQNNVDCVTNEPVVGGVYLLDFLKRPSDYVTSFNSNVSLTKKDHENLKYVVMSLEALKNIIKNNPGVEVECIGHFKLLFCLSNLYNF